MPRTFYFYREVPEQVLLNQVEIIYESARRKRRKIFSAATRPVPFSIFARVGEGAAPHANEARKMRASPAIYKRGPVYAPEKILNVTAGGREECISRNLWNDLSGRDALAVYWASRKDLIVAFTKPYVRINGI